MGDEFYDGDVTGTSKSVKMLLTRTVSWCRRAVKQHRSPHFCETYSVGREIHHPKILDEWNRGVGKNREPR
jgi:hypothetical protein